MRNKKVQVWVFRKLTMNLVPYELEVLLLKLIPERRGYWQPITGGVEKFDAPEENPALEFPNAAWRELREETGFLKRIEGSDSQKISRSSLEIVQPDIIDLNLEFTFNGRWGHSVEKVFGFEVVGKRKPILEPKEHVDFQWLPSKKIYHLLPYQTQQEALRQLVERVLSD